MTIYGTREKLRTALLTHSGSKGLLREALLVLGS